ncbi:DinB family protein [Aeromicrobium sp. CF4.19]|uniref:DinB family protein n=1 Tax=Aeromicrobium sp. CF4.19 TaxID=3373082 RepID=UPI003EE534D0
MAITPDTKDWTWVLSERCPDCGLAAGDVPAMEVGPRLLASVPRWRAVLARPDVARRPDPATWSDLEYACHVRDVLALFAERFRLVLEQDDPLFPDWDQDETAVERDYAGQEPSVVAEELAVSADRAAHVLGSVRGEQWERPARRSNGSTFTLRTLAQYALHDVVHHEVDVRSRRSLHGETTEVREQNGAPVRYVE